MRALVTIVALVALTACGIEGDPEPREEQRPTTGITLTGDARIGVVGSL